MAKELTPKERIAVEVRNRMAAIEAEYLRAKEYDKSEQYFTDQLRGIAKIRNILRQGLMEKAESLMLIGRIQQILLDTYHHELVIMEYEQKKKSLQEQFPQ